MGAHGVVLIDKPKDITSRLAVDQVMRILRVKRAGHFGSLDPFATGLLSVGVGQGTKLLPFMQAHQKEYIAVIGFDKATDTDDHTGVPLEHFSQVHLDMEQVNAWLKEHTGWINQTPPDYCAQKHNGTPLYRLKRANKEVSPRPKQVHIETAKILREGPDWIEVQIVCSRGTYIRSIARDLGRALGYGGYLRELRRLKSEGFCIEDAFSIDALQEALQQGQKVVIPLADALNIPKVRLTAPGVTGVLEGKPVQVSWVKDELRLPEGGYVAMINENEQLVCVARHQPQGGIWGFIERGFRPY